MQINKADPNMMTALVALAAVVFFIFHLMVRPQMFLYPLARQATQAKISYETRNMQQFETDHFIIKYTPADADHVDMIAKAAEHAYLPVTTQLGFTPTGKTVILVYPDRTELRKAFGWSENESAMGVYWGGVIQLLSPQAWLKHGDSVAEFIQTGPMVHEFTHLIFDHMTNGNYPRWFTEGLAQYVEYQVNGYEWITRENHLQQPLYTMEQLDRDFDALPNQSLAYRQSLAAIRYIAEVHGQGSLHNIVAQLSAGQPLEKALVNVLQMQSAAFDAAWRSWSQDNMKNYRQQQANLRERNHHGRVLFNLPAVLVLGGFFY